MSIAPVSGLEQAIDLAEMSHNVSLDGVRAAIEQHVAEAVARERQAIEKICEEFGAWNKTASEILDAIYDRSGKEPKP